VRLFQRFSCPVLSHRFSKQRNKHTHHVLVEAAKLAPRQDNEPALVYEKEKQKGNANRATLAVARKMVARERQTGLFSCAVCQVLQFAD
jgi:hypothetical protein